MAQKKVPPLPNSRAQRKQQNGPELRRADDPWIDPRLNELDREIAAWLPISPATSRPRRKASAQAQWLERMRSYIMAAVAKGATANSIAEALKTQYGKRLKEEYGFELSRRQLAAYIAQWEGRPNLYVLRRFEEPIFEASAHGKTPTEIVEMLKEKYNFEVDADYLANVLPALRREVPARRGRAAARLKQR